MWILEPHGKCWNAKGFQNCKCWATSLRKENAFKIVKDKSSLSENDVAWMQTIWTYNLVIWENVDYKLRYIVFNDSLVTNNTSCKSTMSLRTMLEVVLTFVDQNENPPLHRNIGERQRIKLLTFQRLVWKW